MRHGDGDETVLLNNETATVSIPVGDSYVAVDKVEVTDLNKNKPSSLAQTLMKLKNANNVASVQPLPLDPISLGGKKASLMDTLKDSFVKDPKKLLNAGQSGLFKR